MLAVFHPQKTKSSIEEYKLLTKIDVNQLVVVVNFLMIFGFVYTQYFNTHPFH